MTLSVKGQGTCNITGNKVRPPSLEGNFLIIHHIYTLVPLTDGPIFFVAVMLICNKPGRRTEERVAETKKGARKQAAYGGERIPGLTVLGKERSVCASLHCSYHLESTVQLI